MNEPFVFVSVSSIKEGKVDEYGEYVRNVVKIIEANEPRLIAFATYINEDGTEATTVQVHPDADSMMFHMQVARDKIETSFEFLKVESMTLCGKMNDQVLGMAKQIAGSGVAVSVNGEALGGFTRPVSD